MKITRTIDKSWVAKSFAELEAGIPYVDALDGSDEAVYMKVNLPDESALVNLATGMVYTVASAWVADGSFREVNAILVVKD